MTRYLVVLTADVEADGPEAAYNDAVTHIYRYPARVWTVPKSLDDDPELVEINPEEGPS